MLPSFGFVIVCVALRLTAVTRAALPRQARRLGAGALDLLDRLRRARGQDLVPVGGDQDVVLDADADAPILGGHAVLHLLGARFFLVLDLLRGGRAEAVAALPHLLLAVLAQVEGHGL